MKINAVFHRKENELEEEVCVIDNVLELPDEEFDYFRRNMITDHSFLSQNSERMGFDERGVRHGMLILGEGKDDGILVDAQGASYARYSAFIPNARQLAELQQAWERAEEKQEENETNELILAEDSAETTAYILNAPDCVSDGNQAMSLFAMLGCSFQDVHLCHCEQEHDLATIDELHQSTLTEQGKADWADVLGAKVQRVFEGSYGLQIELSGVKPQRLCDFSYMLAGHCSVKDYARWVTQEESPTEEKTKEQASDNISGPALSM